METVNETIERVRAWFYRQLEFIRLYPSENHRLIILLSVIDSFAQESSGYSRNNQKAFVDFIQTYSTKYCDILKTLCPVTLYYSNFSSSDSTKLQLRQSTIYSADNIFAVNEAQRLFDLLTDKQKNSARMKHSYAGLTYQLRNKLVHEFTSLNMPLNFQYDSDEQLPHMVCEKRMENGKSYFHHWALCIPEKFVKDVAIDAVENYLKKCSEQNYAPFTKIDRKCYLAWYD